jgi:cytidyltransferase-like protein
MCVRSSIGCVHGRFQPFHKGHEEYVTAALSRVEHLYVGITQYERGIFDQESPKHRLDLAENPFSFWQRLSIIELTLASRNVPRKRFSIVPFPIDNPAVISEFVPTEAVMFTTIYDKWNLEKIRRLRGQGYPVEVLWRRRHKQYVGAEVRAALRADPAKARSLVSECSFPLIKRYFDDNDREVSPLPKI